MVKIRDVTDLEKPVSVRLDRHFFAIIRPRAEDEGALLLVKREIFDVDRTRALVDRAWHPHHEPVVVDENIRRKLNFELAVGAVNQKTMQRCFSRQFV